MPNSNDSNSGCFSGMLRRLLCTGNLPTHPADGLTEVEEPKTEAKIGVSPAELRPGVVARLMGLNSLPDADWVPKQRSPDAVSRSKSVNFADYLLEFDRSQAHHRRVRTSASFREVPPLLNLQNEFLVLYMKDSDEKKKETESNVKKTEMGIGEDKQKDDLQKNSKQSHELTKKRENQRNKIKISKLKDEPRRDIGKHRLNNRKRNETKDLVSVLPSYKQKALNNGGSANSKSTQKKRMIQKESSSEPKLNKKTKTKKNNNNIQIPEPDFDPENHSPVSVLDFSDDRSSLAMEMNSKKAQKTEDQKEQNATKKKDYSSKNREESDGCSEVVGRICRLTEEDIREANWKVQNMNEFEAFEELSMEVERHVVNVFLVQTLDELVSDLIL